jgi:hypothetical protein
MPSAREMRLRIQSVKNISQVTRALETVSASKVRQATWFYLLASTSNRARGNSENSGCNAVQ